MKMDHHYFSSCGLGWAIAETRDEAIKKNVNQFRSEFKTMTKNLQKKGEIGGYIWSVRVNAPIDHKYGINFYRPEGVEITEGRHHYTTYITNKEIQYYTSSGETE